MNATGRLLPFVLPTPVAPVAQSRINPEQANQTAPVYIVLCPLSAAVQGGLREAVREHFSHHLDLLECDPDAERDPVSRAAWDQALDVLSKLTIACRAMQRDLELPRLGPCADGTLDLWWHRKGADMVVNCNGKTGSFFGNDLYNGTRSEGRTLFQDALVAGVLALEFAGPDPFRTGLLTNG